MDEVLTCQANALLNRENKKAADYREAARLFAKANVSVTEVALKLMPPIDEPDLDVLLYQTEAIMFFLQTRLPKVMGIKNSFISRIRRSSSGIYVC